jgi:hypothetical protein
MAARFWSASRSFSSVRIVSVARMYTVYYTTRGSLARRSQLQEPQSQDQSWWSQLQEPRSQDRGAGTESPGRASERRERPLGEMRLPVDRALQVLQLLVEGVSVRAVERLTGTEKKTILRLLAQVGPGCERMLASMVRDVPVRDVECDEIWAIAA